MKNTLKFALAGSIGAIITIIIFLALGLNKKEVIIKHLPAADSMSAKYVSGNYENATPEIDFTIPAQRAMESVVHITSSQTTKYGGRSGMDMQSIPEPFRQFFFFNQPQQSEPRVIQATGSGVIITDDGYIVTNNHVIKDADEVEITLHDNRNYKATVVGADPATDIALLKIDEKELSPIALGNSDKTEVGEWVLAVGNPYNLTSTVTAGIISAKGRNIHINKSKSAVESFIQTDAAVNPGNSGGALVNMNGELIGINTAIASPTGSYSGYSFAVPSNLVEKVVKDLKEYGIVQRGFLGVMIRDVNADLADQEGLDVTEGVYVDSLMENSAGEEAGLEKGDVIFEIDGNKVETSPELQQIVALHKPGDKVIISVDRNSKRKDIEVTLKNKEGNTEIVRKDKVDMLSTLGVELKAISSKEAKKLDIDGGVKVTRLYAGKLRKQTNMQEGFVITTVDGHAVKSVEDIVGLLKDKKGGVLLEGRYPNYPGEFYFAFGM